MKKIIITIHKYPFAYYGDKIFDFVCFFGCILVSCLEKLKDMLAFIGSKLPIEIEIEE